MNEKNKQRHFGLDLFRAVAILSVIIGHGNILIRPLAGAGFPYIPMFRGVDMFFVLSGFLIATKFFKQLHSQEGFKGSFTITFFRNASIRLFPNYFLFLFINLLVSVYILKDAIPFDKWVKYAFFTQNLYEPLIGFFWESWSLSVTVWFYLIFTSLVLLFALFIKTRGNGMRIALLALIIVFLIIPIAFRAYYHYTINFDYFWWDVWIRKMIPTRFDSPFYGILAAWIRFYYPKKWEKYAWTALVTGLGIWLFIVSVKYPVGSLFQSLVRMSISPMAYALMLPIVMRLNKAPVVFQRVVIYISLNSYALYLTNLLSFVIIWHYFIPSAQNALFLYSFFWISVLFSSFVVYEYFEKPINKALGRKKTPKVVLTTNSI